jgi:hypothetical protein
MTPSRTRVGHPASPTSAAVSAAELRRSSPSARTRTATPNRPGKEDILWYYGALIEAFKARGVGPLAEELERVLLELSELAPT